jgi:hypothetical protein
MQGPAKWVSWGGSRLSRRFVVVITFFVKDAVGAQERVGV